MKDLKFGSWSLLNEFRAFALKGNVVDLAIGVIIGAAFAKIIDSLVKHIIMPTISLVLPSDTSYLSWKIAVDGKEIPYGLFLGEVVNFLFVSGALFLFVVKFLGWIGNLRGKNALPEQIKPITRDQELLSEIRDLLRADLARK
ncbi:MAG: large conductance mechanosensitive channel protein MscL [Oligoflexales bacterium]